MKRETNVVACSNSTKVADMWTTEKLAIIFLQSNVDDMAIVANRTENMASRTTKSSVSSSLWANNNTPTVANFNA